jgi:hypothetical protein
MREVPGRGIGRLAGLFAALLMVLLSPASGCVYHQHRAMAPPGYARGHGPPPHAPAHGYRHKHHHDAVDLVFDAGLGVYAVVGRPGYYWYIDHYLRWVSGEWRVSSRIDGVWVVVSSDRVPAKLVAKHAKHGKKAHRRHKRGSAPARQDY